MILAAFFFSLMSLFVKLTGGRVPTQQVVLIRGIFTLVLAYWLVQRAGVSMWGHQKRLLVLRGIVGFISLVCFYYALIHLPLAEATVIQYSNPVWTLWLAWIFLGERLSMLVFGLSLASLLGVVLIARPAFLFGAGAAAFDPLVVTIALAGAVFAAGAYVMVRKLGETEHAYVIVFYFALVTVIASLPALALDPVRPTLPEWLLLAGVGITALLGQLCLTNGLLREEAGRATSIGYVQIVFAAVWGFIFLAEYPDAWRFAGAALILSSVLALARQRKRMMAS